MPPLDYRASVSLALLAHSPYAYYGAQRRGAQSGSGDSPSFLRVRHTDYVSHKPFLTSPTLPQRRGVTQLPVPTLAASWTRALVTVSASSSAAAVGVRARVPGLGRPP